MSAAAKGTKRPRRPVYFVVALAGDVPRETGVLVPLTKWDQRDLRARKLGLGTEIRAELRKPRNIKFHRLVHALGSIAVEQIEGFEGLNAHQAIKRLQEEAEIFCDVEYVDASPVIKTVLVFAKMVLGDAATAKLAAVLPAVKKIKVKQARSLAFDELDETEFQELAAGIYRHLQREYWPSMTAEAIALMVEIYERDA